MDIKCHVCLTEFPIPKISSKKYYACPKCGTYIQLWSGRNTIPPSPKVKDDLESIGGRYELV